MVTYFEYAAMMFILIAVISSIVVMWFGNPVPYIIGLIIYISIIIWVNPQGIQYRQFSNSQEFYKYMETYMRDVLTATELVSNSRKSIMYVFDKTNRSRSHNFVIAKLVDEQDEPFANQLFELAFSNLPNIPDNVKLTSNVKYIYNDDNIVSDAVITVNVIPND